MKSICFSSVSIPALCEKNYKAPRSLCFSVPNVIIYEAFNGTNLHKLMTNFLGLYCNGSVWKSSTDTKFFFLFSLFQNNSYTKFGQWTHNTLNTSIHLFIQMKSIFFFFFFSKSKFHKRFGLLILCKQAYDC